MRRRMYQRYFNFMYHFDVWSHVLESYCARVYDWYMGFDSVEASWRVKKGKVSEWRERFRLRDQIDRK